MTPTYPAVKERDHVRNPYRLLCPASNGGGLMLEAVLAAAIATGPAYPVPASQVTYMQCVAERESHANPRSTNSADGYYGMFQFSEALKDGATWMMLDWLKTWHPSPRKFAAQLREIPMNKWPRNLQVAAFIETLNNDGAFSGARHWAGGRFHCAAVAS